jgi:HD-GYP domain-containing protein (c-di-GMP phosphodiesterase class II)
MRLVTTTGATRFKPRPITRREPPGMADASVMRSPDESTRSPRTHPWCVVRRAGLLLALATGATLLALHRVVVAAEATDQTRRVGALAAAEILLAVGVGVSAGLLLVAGRLARRLRREQAEADAAIASAERALDHRVAQALASRNALVMGLARLADQRETDSGAHLERISAYAVLLADELRSVRTEIDGPWLEAIRLASALHDIGKLNLPDALLRKQAQYTPEERRQMQRHTTLGADALIAVRRRLGDDLMLDLAIQSALEHHERWDGTGYPLGLKGEEIALSARILALADLYDALTTERPYRAAMTHHAAKADVAEAAGTHLDPAVVAAFERVHERFDEVRQAYQPQAAHPCETEQLAA